MSTVSKVIWAAVSLLLIFAVAPVVLFIGQIAIVYFVFLGGEDRFEMVSQLRDKASGKYIALSEVESIVAFTYRLDVYATPSGDRTPLSDLPILAVSNVDWRTKPSLTFDGTCYALSVRYLSGGLNTGVWADPDTGTEMCFRLSPRSTTRW